LSAPIKPRPSAACSRRSEHNSPVVARQKSKPEHDPSKFEHAPHIRVSCSPRSSAFRTPHSPLRTSWHPRTQSNLIAPQKNIFQPK
jgi:hypothetical protein